MIKQRRRLKAQQPHRVRCKTLGEMIAAILEMEGLYPEANEARKLYRRGDLLIFTKIAVDNCPVLDRATLKRQLARVGLIKCK